MKKIILLMVAAATIFSTASASAIDWGWFQSDVDSITASAASIKNIWDKQSLEKIIDGKFAVPDDTINAAIAQQIAGDDRLKALSITSKENGRLEIHADTKSQGRVELSGTIDACVHNGTTSYVTYTVKDKDLKDHGGITGWMFSHLSLSLLEKMVGPIQLSDSLPSKIKGNSITVDYSQILQKSDLAQASIYGYNLLDALVIDGAVPHDGYVEFQTSLNIPDKAKTLLLSIFD